MLKTASGSFCSLHGVSLNCAHERLRSGIDAEFGQSGRSVESNQSRCFRYNCPMGTLGLCTLSWPGTLLSSSQSASSRCLAPLPDNPCRASVKDNTACATALRADARGNPGPSWMSSCVQPSATDSGSARTSSAKEVFNSRATTKASLNGTERTCGYFRSPLFWFSPVLLT